MPQSPTDATIPDVTQRTIEVTGEALHYVSAGDSGSPVLLVHGFPESWWAFRLSLPDRGSIEVVDAGGVQAMTRRPRDLWGA